MRPFRAPAPIVPVWRQVEGPITGEERFMTRAPGDASVKVITKYGTDRVYLEIVQPGIGVRWFSMELKEMPEPAPAPA
ncbi:MAG: hypothetical protein NW201_04295 [Gemmatimonadales bacterium]|nr:hypothetical protein [Gemmatimonadales bacterium]